MSLLGAPLDDEELEELRQLFPEYDGDLPEEARYWQRGDVELFLASCGQLRPQETARPGAETCALLSRLRLRLADEGVGAPTAEYKSLCRHLSERGMVESLPGLAETTPVARAAKAPPVLKAPVVLQSREAWRAEAWTMDFWRSECGGDWWKFRARSPMFEGDARGSAADRVFVEGTAEEYVEYVRMLHKSDPSCEADNAVAYPRVAMDGWTPFVGSARAVFESCWRELLPSGVRDLTTRWVRMFAAAFNMDWLEFMARYFKVTIGAAGSASRLHVENHRAHAWFAQLEGRRLFVLFAPKEASAGRLYEEAGGLCDGPEGFAASASPVDVFYPSAKRHPKLAEARAQVVVLKPGETLVVPSGWFRFSVALEPSVTLHHPFWNSQNRGWIVDEFREAFDQSKMPPELQEMASHNFQDLRERIQEDDDSDQDEDD